MNTEAKISTLLEDTDALVSKYNFDHNEHYYGSLGHIEDVEKLNEARESLMDFIEQDKSEAFINKFHLLLEVERELTLRENQ